MIKKCFIVCPISSEGSDTRNRSDKLLKHVISPICENCGFEAIRIDNLNTNGIITDEIIDHLKNDELVIADISELNPNAFYEIGYRSAIGKPIIHLKSKSDLIPFDISTIRTFDYDITDLDSVEEVKERLIKTIKNLNFNFEDINSDKSTSTNFNAQILQELYKIQDDISDLKTIVKSSDTSTISVLVDKLATTNAKTPDVVLMETILPKLIENPKQLMELADIMNKLPNTSKQ